MMRARGIYACRPGQAKRRSGTHMWTAPCSQEAEPVSDRSECGHMSGLLVRSHTTAAKMGSTSTSSKHTQRCLAPMGPSECCLVTVIDRSGPSSVLEQASACDVRLL